MSTKKSFDDFVTWATTPAESGLRLYGWSALVASDIDTLNQSWADLENSAPPEVTEHVKTNLRSGGVNALYLNSRLERPFLNFDRLKPEDNVTLRCRIQSQAVCSLRKEEGSPSAKITSINLTQSPTSTLYIHTHEPRLNYTSENNVALQWDDAAYEIKGSHNNDLAGLYEEYFKRKPDKTVDLGRFTPESGGIIKPLSFTTHVDSKNDQVIALINLGQAGGIPRDQSFQVEGRTATSLVDRRASPSVAPADMAQLPRLLAPHQAYSIELARTDTPKDHVAAYRLESKKATAPTATIATYDLYPLSAATYSGGTTKLSVFPLPPVKVEWKLKPGSQGTLAPQGDDWIYRSPNTRDFYIDVATTEIEGQLYESVFVTRPEKPVGILKFSKKLNNLQLTLIINGSEIPADKVDWKVVHGTGHVNNDGTFIPKATGGSLFSVISAVTEPVPGLRIEACEIIPISLTSVDEFLEMTNY
ncbi:hypothetical protein IAE39_004597 [Pseudomonas sp. S37]|uniref:hypothetical protein n=1 Tax=Pseudomonas sp. S37 TaxID=2767449 RepID=UPI001914AD81|nr:hypothetical protein [Pseudomonas sp. S37]MBK4996423.1 hypothetical protein [Pseudomonas sp. S37]